MARKYNLSWAVKKNQIDFNQKQWRQDIGYFISKKNFWYFAMVTRSRTVDKKKKTKEFEIYTKGGASFKIIYQGQNEIVNCTDLDIVNDYFKFRIKESRE